MSNTRLELLKAAMEALECELVVAKMLGAEPEGARLLACGAVEKWFGVDFSHYVDRDTAIESLLERGDLVPTT